MILFLLVLATIWSNILTNQERYVFDEATPADFLKVRRLCLLRKPHLLSVVSAMRTPTF